jgi:hypothetical protein
MPARMDIRSYIKNPLHSVMSVKEDVDEPCPEAIKDDSDLFEHPYRYSDAIIALSANGAKDENSIDQNIPSETPLSPPSPSTLKFLSEFANVEFNSSNSELSEFDNGNTTDSNSTIGYVSQTTEPINTSSNETANTDSNSNDSNNEVDSVEPEGLILNERELMLEAVLLKSYGWIHYEDYTHASDECPICLDRYNKSYIFVLPCAHIFHKDCILQCILGTKMYKCPDCKIPYTIQPMAF